MFDMPDGNFSSPWGRITKKMVDPITFSCPVDIAFIPRIEECLHETTCLAEAHPRIPGDDNHKLKSRSSDQKSSSPSATSSTSTTTTANTSVAKPLQPSARDRSPYFSPTPAKKNSRKQHNPVANTIKEEKVQAMNLIEESAWAPPFGDDEKKQDPSITTPARNVKTLSPNMVFASFELSPSKYLDDSFSESPSKFLDDSFSDFEDSMPHRRVKDARSPAPRSSPPSGGKIKNSLGAFLKMASQEIAVAAVEADNQSFSSKSLSSRSVADRSHAERSKAEQKLFDATQKLHDGDESSHAGSPSSRSRRSRVVRRSDSNRSLTMRPIDELSLADFSAASSLEKNNGSGSNGSGHDLLLSNFTNILPAEEEDRDHDADGRSLSQRSTSERSNKENKVAEVVKSPWREKQKLIIKEDSKEDLEDEDEDDDIESITMEEVVAIVIQKKLWFKDGHEEFEIPYPTNSMYDDLFWTEDELGDFRYAAFLEDAGLDVDEYM